MHRSLRVVGVVDVERVNPDERHGGLDEQLGGRPCQEGVPIAALRCLPMAVSSRPDEYRAAGDVKAGERVRTDLPPGLVDHHARPPGQPLEVEAREVGIEHAQLPPAFVECMADQGYEIGSADDMHSAPMQALQTCLPTPHGGEGQ